MASTLAASSALPTPQNAAASPAALSPARSAIPLTPNSPLMLRTPDPKTPQMHERDSDDLAESFTELFNFTPELDAAVAGVLDVKEPLDQQDFNPIAYINHIFPDEQSLASIDVVQGKLRIKIRKLDREIKELVRTQNDAGGQGVAELEAAKKAIQDLFGKIKHIKEKAQQSELMVQEITHDIKSLDFAKRHLTTSITALRRLQMLVNAVDQLKISSAKKQYKEAGQLLQAVLQLISHFISYKNVRQILDLSDQINNLQADLRKQIYDDFEKSFTNQGAITGHAQTLKEACEVVDTLGRDAKNQLVDWYCDLQLKQYRAIFGDVSSEVAALDNTSRRYAWLKRFMKTFDEEHKSVFPATWRMSEIFCERFCEATKKDLKNILAATPTLDVKLLLKTLQQTIEFEGGLAKRFSRNDVAVVNARGEGVSPTVSAPSKSFKVLSGCFEPYLSHYIESEDKVLAEMIENYKQQPPSTEDDASNQVLSSSTDLFFFYRETLVHCSTLSTRKPFLDLCKLFSKWLFVYANEVLIGKLPKDEKRPNTTDELRMISLILNTADYCHNTTSQLEEKLKEKIDPEFKEQFSFEREKETFLTVLSTCIKALVRGVEASQDAALAMMCKTPWGTLASVGDQSEYISIMISGLRSSVTVIRSTISQNRYFKSFCDKFVESFAPRFMINIQKCRPISEVGAEQMLLDTHAIKTALLELPSMGSDTATSLPATYTKLVNKGLGKAETLLKVIMTPPDPPEGMVETYIMLFADNSVASFQKVLDLKGLKKGEQQTLIEAFQHRLPPPPSGTVVTGTPSANSNSNSNTSNAAANASNPSTSTSTTTTTTSSSFTAPLSSLSNSTFGSSTAGASTKFNENFKKFVGGFNMKRGDATANSTAAATSSANSSANAVVAQPPAATTAASGATLGAATKNNPLTGSFKRLF